MKQGITLKIPQVIIKGCYKQQFAHKFVWGFWIPRHETTNFMNHAWSTEFQWRICTVKEKIDTNALNSRP